jgi:hypothetical protein
VVGFGIGNIGNFDRVALFKTGHLWLERVVVDDE